MFGRAGPARMEAYRRFGVVLIGATRTETTNALYAF
jgi:hypothetical protein